MVTLEKYFCVCSECGSVDWMDGEGNSNALNDDGELINDNDKIAVSRKIMFGKEIFCHTCEKTLFPISFGEVTKKERIKIYKMNDEKRINWKKSLDIVNNLEEEKTTYITFKMKM